MRLFYALQLDQETKRHISDLQTLMQQDCTRGSFTKEENLHLTLCFLGDIDAQYLTLLEKILLSLVSAPLELTFNQLGLFKNRQGDILWIGVEHNLLLEQLQATLAMKLSGEGLYLDPLPFTAHVTLARNIKAKKLPVLEPFVTTCNKISLMHSHQTQFQLVYTPLYTLVL